ncbi:MAG TPA: outer membrane beta-barrel protein, partial [Segetibacter sp.]
MKVAVSLMFFYFLFVETSFSQGNNGKLIGFITDSTHKPLTYATINLLKAGQAPGTEKRTYTTNKGFFEVRADTGNYILTVTHTGFTDVSINTTIRTGDNKIDDIALRPANHILQNVTVVTKKPLIEQGDDKLTYNVENDPAAKSESASDILRKTPLVTVDGDGNVQVNGQSNFKILLNGRETSMFAMNVKEALKNFPGGIISKIEVITSPSAKYDAEGVGGIINIITKKKVIGYNVYLNSYYSTLTNYTENASFNIKAGKFGVSGYIGTSGSAKDIRGRNINETTPFGNAAFSKRTLTGERLGRNIGTFGNMEVIYEVDSFKTLAAYGSLSGFRSNSHLNQAIITEYGQQPSQASLFLQDNRSINPSSGFGTDFIRKFRNTPEKELTFRFSGQFSRNNGFNNSLQDNVAQDRFVSNESISKNREYTIQADFVQPLKAKQKLELGMKGILRNASSDFQSMLKYNSNESYKPNPLNTDRFNYHQEVYSAYTSYSFSFKK